MVSPTKLPEQVRLNVPYHTQINNHNNPYGTCNVTSIAMCLSFYGVKPRAGVQLEDELFEWMQRQGLDNENHQHLEMCANYFGGKFGVSDHFYSDSSIEKVKQNLATGNPCVIAGDFTASGHVIAVVGYDKKGLIVNDSYGEWFDSGYQNLGEGEGLHYSYGMIERLCCYDNQFWVHLFGKE